MIRARQAAFRLVLILIPGLTFPLVMAASALLSAQSGAAVTAPESSARFAFVDAGQLEQAAAARLVDEPPSIVEDRPNLLDAADTAVRGHRADEWEIGALAAMLGNDPSAAFEFVRDRIAFDPYAGVLRGPDGTLAARAGNAWDRALLLRALLAKTGNKTRLAFANLNNETAARLIARAQVRPANCLPDGTSANPLGPVVARIASRARRDEAALRLALGARLGELGTDDGAPLLQEVARHMWVQVLKGNAWIDLDPTLPDAEVGKPLAAASGTAQDVSQKQCDTIVVRVIAETLSNDKLRESVVLERTLPAASAARQYILLVFLPNQAGGGLLSPTASMPTSFVPTLVVANEAQAGRIIVTKSSGGGVGFGSLLGGGDEPPAELAGLFIELATGVPGRPPVLARHVLLDRVAPNERANATIKATQLSPLSPDGDVPRGLRGFHHLMISTGGTNPLDTARLRLSVLDAALNSGERAREQAATDWPASPLWASDLTLVEGSERTIVKNLDSTNDGRVYIGEPRVFLASWFPEQEAAGVLSRETDLLIDSVRVLLPAGVPAAKQGALRQLQYGALQSALETESALRMAAAWDPAGREVISTSLAMRDRLTVLAPADVERLPMKSAGALRRALRAGSLAVVPGDAETATAWWTVAPSGFVRAIVEPGAGMSSIKVTPPSPGAGAGNQGRQQGKKGGSGTEYLNLLDKIAKPTVKVAQKTGQVIRDTFEAADPVKAKRLAKLLGGM